MDETEDSSSFFDTISDASSNTLDSIIGGVSNWIGSSTQTILSRVGPQQPTSANGEIISPQGLRSPTVSPQISAKNIGVSDPSKLFLGLSPVMLMGIGAAAYFLLKKR